MQHPPHRDLPRPLYRNRPRKCHGQNGVSLLAVMALLLLSAITVLGSFRVARLSEGMVGNGSDYARAFAAAEALLHDAEIDIRGRLPPYEILDPDGQPGSPCRPDVPNTVGCRIQDNLTPWFPRDSPEFNAVSDVLGTLSNGGANGVRCQQGICAPTGLNDLDGLWQQQSVMEPLGACYGQFTRIGLTATATANDGNPLLDAVFDRNGRCTHGTARYWVEIFRYDHNAAATTGPASALLPELSRNFIYRITAIAHGTREGTRVILRSIFVPFPAQPPL